jgi:hypothetical protein
MPQKLIALWSFSMGSQKVNTNPNEQDNVTHQSVMCVIIFPHDDKKKKTSE